jgi:large subunit ribosomal protein L1
MAKSKAELLAEAKDLGLEVTTKNTVAEITAAIAAISQTPVEPVETGDLAVAEAGVAEEKKTAKSGKRSEKGQKEAEEKVAKTEAQKHRAEEKAEEAANDKPKQVQRATTKLDRSAKGYRKSVEQLEKGKVYSLKEAVNLAVKTSHVKFDATVELHVRLGVDPRQADQNLRDTIVLPAGTGKTVRVAVFADADNVAVAKKAGADIAAGEELLQELDKGKIDFDILVATPQMMAKLGKYARVLGPKGLMPNPKSGTVTTDVAKAVTEAKAGRVEYRVDTTGIIHVGVGKVSFGADKLSQNLRAIFASIKQNKPSSLKGSYVQSIYLATTMGPSIKVESSEI